MPDWASLLRPSARRILEALLDGPLTLTELAARCGVTKPSVSRPLRELESLGAIRRHELRDARGREVQYSLVGVSIHLEIHPEERYAISWASTGPNASGDLLLAQIRDPALRAELQTLLGAWRVQLAARTDPTDPTPSTIAGPIPWWERISLVVYGSVARGEATWKSDIDVLVVGATDVPASIRNVMLDAAADVETTTKHAVRVQFTTLALFLAADRVIDREAREEGVVVHAGGGEDRLWPAMTRYRRISI